MPAARGSLAEGKRFELLVRGYRTLVFKTSSFGRSDNLPQLVVFHRRLPATKQARGSARCTLDAARILVKNGRGP
ncbi:hypothetical protein ARTHRO8AJ_410042 [Arthrobacter sp. 8AJ]|nr:hypothetical protein ARTHRO8AJ_410042 [Arthrobacter sp. 8AJ]